jgi:lauroyl/myristoyl acyltransferase
LGAIDMADPMRPANVPLPLAALAEVRNFVYRALPLPRAISLAAATSRLDMLRRPGRRRQLLSVLRTVGPAAHDEQELRAHLALARALRKIGANTYAPVFRRSRDWLLKELRPEGLEHLDALRAAGSGAVILSTHAGPNGWVGPALRQLGYPLRLNQRKRSTVDYYVLMRRDGLLASVSPYPSAGESGLHLKKLYALLRKGTWVQHIGDYPVAEGGVRGAYMGRPVQCAPGPWALARLARAPVVPVLFVVDRRHTCRMFVCPPIHVGTASPAREALDGPFQTYLDFLGRHLQAAPWNVGLKHWQKLFATDWPQGTYAWG